MGRCARIPACSIWWHEALFGFWSFLAGGLMADGLGLVGGAGSGTGLGWWWVIRGWAFWLSISDERLPRSVLSRTACAALMGMDALGVVPFCGEGTAAYIRCVQRERHAIGLQVFAHGRHRHFWAHKHTYMTHIS